MFSYLFCCYITDVQAKFISISFVGFGFLSFEDEDSVDRCVAEHFINLNGKQVVFCEINFEQI